MLKGTPPDRTKQARMSGKERKLRHKSRVQRLARIPKVKEGRTLSDERAWMD
jgi:hypothetical protein